MAAQHSTARCGTYVHCYRLCNPHGMAISWKHRAWKTDMGQRLEKHLAEFAAGCMPYWMNRGQKWGTCVLCSLIRLARPLSHHYPYIRWVTLIGVGHSKECNKFFKQILQKYVRRYVRHPAPPQFLPRKNAKTASYL